MNANLPTIRSIQVALPTTQHMPDGRRLRTGLYKQPVTGGVFVGALNLDGDGQGDLRYHGGKDKAICCFAHEHYASVADYLSRPGNETTDELTGFSDSLQTPAFTELPLAAFGENFTLENLLEHEVCIGDQYQVGEVIIEISQPRQPCNNLARRYNSRGLVEFIIKEGCTGWYARVIKEGSVEAGDTLQLIQRPHPDWTIDRLNCLMYSQSADKVELAAAANLSVLSEAWRKPFLRKAGHVHS